MVRLSEKRVRASTLIEAIVGLVILMIIGGLALNVFVKVSRMEYSVSQAQSLEQMNTLLDSTIRTCDYNDEDFVVRGNLYNRKARPYNGYQNLWIISIEEHREGKLIGVMKRIVRGTRQHSETNYK